jgi:large subunit ribosomal protein L17
MRHGKKFNHLGRTKPHREAMLSNMACSLIENKRINTTVAKAKALRTFIEPLITKSKSDSTHSRRMVFRQLNDKTAVADLFRDVAPKVANRPGGYTRIIRTGYRLGDNAEMCMVELVDFNDVMLKDTKPGKSRRRKKKSAGTGSTPIPTAEVKAEESIVEDKKVEAPKTEDKVEVKAENKSEKKEEAKAEVKKEEAKAEVKKEEVKAEVKKEEAKAEVKKEEVKAEVKKEEVKAEVKKEEVKAEEKPKVEKSEPKKDKDSDIKE